MPQFNFFKELQSVETLKQRNWETTPTDARTVVDLLIDQIEFANGTAGPRLPKHGLDQKPSPQRWLACGGRRRGHGWQ